MSPPRSVAVVMPAYNEAGGITEFITELHAAFEETPMFIVIGVVDDCSSDETGAEAERAGAATGCPVTVVVNSENSGHGFASVRAWRLGLSLGAEIIVHVDGDGQFSGCDVVRVAMAGKDADGAVGIRITRADPWFRRVVTASLRTYLGLMIGTRIRDVNTPLRMYQADRLSALLDALPESPLIPSVYLSAGAATQGLDIVEVEVTSRDRRGDVAIGSTWGRPALSFLPSKRFAFFVLSAAKESIGSLWSLRRQEGRSS